MAEYAAHPLWDRSPGGFGDIDPADLNVSPELGRRLTTWNDVYERRLNGPVDQVDAESWRREGLSLAHQLQHELGAEVQVLYFDDRTGVPRSLDDRQLWS
jgi:hypothetical protein